MKFSSKRSFRKFIKEAIESDRIIKERPWSVEYTFTLSGGSADDSEGTAPDGFEIDLTSESGESVSVIVDSYWNPQNGDQSGNELRIESEGRVIDRTYVPVRFDDGNEQIIVISNSPVKDVITISHGLSGTVPIVYLSVKSPFTTDDDDIEFTVKKLGNGNADVELTDHANV